MSACACARWPCAGSSNREPSLLEAEDIRLLTEVGFLAAARGDLRRAEVIFGALQSHRPGAAFAYVGPAMAMLNRGQSDEAVRELDRGIALAGGESRAELLAFRGLALQLAGRASESLRALRAASSHPLAQHMLGEEPSAVLQEK
jgi:hypothetical protein